MDNKLMTFENAAFGKIRTLTIDGEPWFVAVDVCRALEIGNPTDAMRRLDADERTLVSIEGASNGLPVNAVNEPGLYTLIPVLASRRQRRSSAGLPMRSFRPSASTAGI